MQAGRRSSSKTAAARSVLVACLVAGARVHGHRRIGGRDATVRGHAIIVIAASSKRRSTDDQRAQQNNSLNPTTHLVLLLVRR